MRVDWEGVAALAQILAACGTVIALLLVGRQLRMMAEQNRHLARELRLSAEAVLDTNFATITAAYLDHPWLRPVFNEHEGTPGQLDELDEHRASALAEALADAMERSITMAQEGLIGMELRAWIEDSCRHSQFFRKWLDAHRSWYCAELLAIRDSMEHERPLRQAE